ncbi:hypothetical protein TIFTF001_003882 [Ficus carica]|uniref:Uncharacterized protein n=1 Tax=Ficus carica TaxID=3494 RepID=A0AA88CWB1_FICCA|nr:hypothetical protein TIFTF001_003882 [Ficus carica]
MGSIEEERLGEMVHDFIESESTPLSTSITTSPHHYSNTLPMPPAAAPPYNQTNYSTLQAIVGRSTKAEAEVLERVLNHITRINKNNNIITSSDGIRNLLVMKLKMDGYNASLCHTSWVTSLGCPAGDYEYIDINMVLEKEEEEEEGKNGNSKMKKRRVIVDIEFKSQFEVARPTPAYKHLTDSLPMIFVGTEDKLIQIISILCSAAKQSLIDSGLHVPPWRSTAYMHSKWLSHSPDPYSNINYNYIITKKYSNWEWTPPNPNPNPDPDPNNPIFNNIKPANKNKIRNLVGVSALSTQFSNMSINCC